jgi:hypothetical protein
VAPLAALLVCAAPACAWHYEGHRAIVERTLPLLEGRVPGFFIAASNVIGHCSGDPDAVKDLSPDVLKRLEGPEHYLDFEALGTNAALPPSRLEFFGLCKERDVRSFEIGLLPYATLEWTERLKVAFAQHRRRPSDPAIQAKIAVYAGHLAHYAGDLCQPLHLTIHHDGRATAEHPDPRTGIHNKVDALLGKAAFEPDAVKGVTPARQTNLAARVSGMVYERAPIGRVYELEDRIPDVAVPLGGNPPVQAFCRDRLRAAASLTADLFLSAWEDSANVVFPEWFEQSHPREATGK